MKIYNEETNQGLKKGFLIQATFWLISVDEYGLTRQRAEGEEKKNSVNQNISHIKTMHSD